MKQISLHVYQSIDGCPAPSDKHFDAAVDASSCVLIDEETYLRIYMTIWVGRLRRKRLWL